MLKKLSMAYKDLLSERTRGFKSSPRRFFYFKMESKSIELGHNNSKISLSLLLRTVGNDHIVCIHGLKSNKGYFREMLELSFFRKYSAVSFDLVGFGKSRSENFSYDLKEQAEVIEEAINKLGITNIHLIGHSMGGMIGILLLERLGSKIKSFVNMEGNLVLSDCGMSREIIKLPRKESPENDAVYYSSKSIVKWAESEKLLDIFLKAKQKKLYLYGDRCKEKIKSVKGKIEFAEISNSGHFMLRDNPEETYKKIEIFLRNI